MHWATMLLTCAWVLWTGHWRQSTVATTGGWEPVRGFPTKEACEAALPAELKKARDDLETLRRLVGGKISGEGTYVALSGKDAVTSSELRCLPDTIDPRTQRR